jgi:protein dithiol:quinone oxidoreductase
MPMHALFQYRSINALLVIAIAGLLGTGYYMQFVMHLEPCPLCMTQRLCFMATGLIALLALIHNPRARGRAVYGALGALFAFAGVLAASRQVWLQHLPKDQVPACGPDFNYIIETFPLLEAVQIMIRGNGNCAEVDWAFLGLSIAGWSLLWFLFFVAVHLWQAVRRAA